MKLKTIRASVKKIRDFDPDTALNVNMLNRMIDNGQISYEWHGNRKIINYDALVQRLNTLFELDCPRTAYPHHRQCMEGSQGDIIGAWHQRGTAS